MKEHAISIKSSIPASQKQLAMQADQFKQQFDRLLAETIRLANGSVSSKALQAGQYVTRYTEASEQAVQQFTGIEINSNLTRMEYNIQPSDSNFNTQQLEQQVSTLNQYIFNLTDAFARFKSDLMNSQATCRLFTFLYYADLNHIFHEAMRYIDVLNGLQKRDERFNQNYIEFWNHNMSDHTKSMRGLFDPTETAYFNEADRFAKMFDALTASSTAPAGNVLADTKAISDFKANTTQGLLECKVKAIMAPLYTDHLLRVGCILLQPLNVKVVILFFYLLLVHSLKLFRFFLHNDCCRNSHSAHACSHHFVFFADELVQANQRSLILNQSYKFLRNTLYRILCQTGFLPSSIVQSAFGSTSRFYILLNYDNRF
jgi:hypothetical protein